MDDQLRVRLVTFSAIRRRTLLNLDHAKRIHGVPLDDTSGIDPWSCRFVGFGNSTSFGCATPVGSEQPTGATLRPRDHQRPVFSLTIH